MDNKPKKSWYKKWWGIAIIVTLAIIGLTMVSGFFVPEEVTDTEPKKIEKTATKTAEPKETKETSKSPVKPTPEYKIVYTKKDYGVVKQDEYYVLIDPIDLSNDDFKKDIEAIITDIAKKKKTADFFANLFTNREVLDEEYEPAPLGNNVEENKKVMKENAEKLAVNLVAQYAGGFNYLTGKQDSSLNGYEISYFSATFTTNPTVGKYVGYEKFKPKL